jgi:hypothetical protein
MIVPEMLQHAEVLFYVFRDTIAHAVPKELETVAGSVVSHASLETKLNTISGKQQKDLRLDRVAYHTHLTTPEWIELVPLLESPCSQ